MCNIVTAMLKRGTGCNNTNGSISKENKIGRINYFLGYVKYKVFLGKPILAVFGS